MTDADFLRALTHGPRFIPEVEAHIRAIADQLDLLDARERELQAKADAYDALIAHIIDKANTFDPYAPTYQSVYQDLLGDIELVRAGWRP